MSGEGGLGFSQLCGLVLLFAVIGCQMLPFSVDKVELYLLEMQDYGDQEEKDTAEAENPFFAVEQLPESVSVVHAGKAIASLNFGDRRPPFSEILIPPPDQMT